MRRRGIDAWSLAALRWGVVAVAGVCALVFVVSGWCEAWWSVQRVDASSGYTRQDYGLVYRGRVHVSGMGFSKGRGVTQPDGWAVRRSPSELGRPVVVPRWDWGWDWHRTTGPVSYSYMVRVPLWAGVAPAGVVFAGRALWRWRTRPRAGRCASCGYDLAGLSEGAVCPECAGGGGGSTQSGGGFAEAQSVEA
jgi:hypothetical protein